jgi:hypothetical protein
MTKAREPLEIRYRPDRETQLRALLEGREYELVGEAYHGRGFRFATAPDSAITDFCADEIRAVFTVNIHDLIEYAVQSRWVDRAVHRSRIGGDGSWYLLLEGGLYKYMFTERGYTTELFASPNVRDALEAYLVNEVRTVNLEGTDELRAARAGLWNDPYEGVFPDRD